MLSLSSANARRFVFRLISLLGDVARKESSWLTMMFLVLGAIWAKQAALVIPTNHIDGTFQTASGLFRLLNGEVPGRDFFPYLGIGPLLLLFLPFILSGADLSGSIFSSYFATFLIISIGCGLISCLAARSRSSRLFFISALIPICLSRYGGDLALLNHVLKWKAAGSALNELIVPGNSLRPLRSAAPIFLSVAALWLHKIQLSQKQKVTLYGIFCGAIGATWSNDFAAISVAGGLAACIAWLIHNRRFSLSLALRLAGSFALSFALIGIILTAGYFAEQLQYNYSDVRSDQFWYFAPWGKEFRVFSLRDLYWDIRWEGATYSFVVLVTLTGVALWAREFSWLLLSWIGWVLFCGGAVATVGGHEGGYFTSFRLWAFFATVGFALALFGKIGTCLKLQVLKEKRPDHVSVSRRVAKWFPATMIGASLVTLIFVEVQNYEEAESLLASADNFVWDPTLDGYREKDLAGVSSLQLLKSTDLVEEYFSLSSVFNGHNSRLKVDSVIHALGEQREDFAKELTRKPKLVTTTNPSYSVWSLWNLSANWWFYKTLFSSYVPETLTKAQLLWTRDESRTWSEVPCRIIDGGRIQIDGSDRGFVEIELTTSRKMGSREYLMVQNNINFAADGNGFVALDPGKQTHLFPAFFQEGRSRVLQAHVVSNSPMKTNVFSDCNARQVSTPSASKATDIFAAHLTEADRPISVSFGEWKNGRSTKRPAFLILNTTLNRSRFYCASLIELDTLGSYKIDRIVDLGNYLSVELDLRGSSSFTSGVEALFKPVSTGGVAKRPCQLSDTNWSQGVSRTQAGFFIENTFENLSVYRTGQKIRLSDGLRATILSVKPNADFIEVYVDGNREFVESLRNGSFMRIE